jgi:predicted HTH domain antitoxin
MTRKSFTTALTLYRGRALTLEEAADYGGVSAAKFASALESRGIPVYEYDDASPSNRPIERPN